MSEAQPRGFDQAVNKRSKADRRECGSHPIGSLLLVFIPAFRDPECGDNQYDRRQRYIDKKHRAPRYLLDQPSPHYRTDRRGDRSKTRPRADRAATIFFAERGADDGKTSRYEKSAARALDRASEDQFVNVTRESAPQRGERKDCHAEDKDATSSVTISQRTSQEQECRKQQRIGFDDPLNIDNGCVQTLL